MGACALVNIGANAQSRVVIASAGGIDAVISGMAKHWSDTEVQKETLAALANIAANNPDNMLAVCERGGIRAVLSALVAHRKNVEILEAGCRTLALLLSTPKQHSQFLSAGIIDTVTKAMAAFPSSVRIRRNFESITRVQDAAVAQAVQHGRCVLAYAPRCKERCNASLHAYCVDCSIAQRVFTCVTCHSSRSNVRYCQVCFAAHHASQGHDGIERFVLSSCDCDLTACKIPHTSTDTATGMPDRPAEATPDP
jgi:hypothetical protein